MLVLTLRIGERSYISDDIRVVVFSVNDNQVRLGIGAPKHIAVHRQEIHRRILK